MTHSILFVDDDQDLLEFLQEVSRPWRYQVYTASSGKKALELVQAHAIQVAIVDQRMPEMMGIELLNQLREQAPEIIRIMMTGYTDLQSAIDAINQGSVFRFLRKPFEIDVLHDAIEDAMSEYEKNKGRELLFRELNAAKLREEHSMTDHAAHIMVISLESPGGAIIHANPVAIDFIGKPGDAIIGVSLEQVFPGVDEQSFWIKISKDLERYSIASVQMRPHGTGKGNPLYNAIVFPDPTADQEEAVTVVLTPVTQISEAEKEIYEYVRDLEDSAALKDRGLQFLYEMSKKIGTTQDFNGLVQTIFADLNQIMDFDIGLLATFQERETTVFVRSGYDLNDETRQMLQKEIGEQYQGETRDEMPEIRLGLQIKHLNGFPIDEETPGMPSPIKASVNIPLYSPDDTLVGLIYIGSCSKKSYSGEEIRLFATFSSRIALVLHIINNLFLFREVKEMAIKDSLTGLYNRRYFEEHLTKELERARRYSSDLSFLILDIDHFKKVNDTYGHLNGDEILKSLAELMNATTRNIDIPVRYGGEEFVIILPETPPNGAMVIAERLRSRVENHPFKLIGEIAEEVPEINISISIGLSHVKDSKTITAEELVEQGDRALYQAKSQGRNQVVNFDTLKAEVS